MTEKKTKKISRGLFFIISAFVFYSFYILLDYCSIMTDYKMKYWDTLILFFQQRAPDPHIITITVSNEDREALGGWPCDHRMFAKVVNFLKDAGAKVIVFDFFFKQDSPGDKEFLKAIKEHGKVVFALPWDDNQKCLDYGPEKFRQNGGEFGHVAVVHQKVYRYFPLYIVDSFAYDSHKSLKDNDAIPALALKSVELYKDLNEDTMKFNGNHLSPLLLIDSLSIPMLPAINETTGFPDCMLINYCGPQDCFNKSEQQFRISVIINENKYYASDRERLKKKANGNIVLIYNTFDPNDRFGTPFSMKSDDSEEERMPGGEIHAQEISNLLDCKFIRYYRFIDTLAPLFFLLLGVLVFSAPIQLKTRFILFGIILIPWPVISILLFVYARIVTAIWPPIVMLVLLLISLLYYERRQFITLFGDFVSHRLKDQVLMDASKGTVGTREVEATIVFADIRGFSTFSEKLSPGELTDKMTEYHTEMNRIFERNHGQILDYLGDAEMVGFGILGEDRYHPLRAIKSGLEMQIEIAKIRERWNLPGGQQFEVGVGICTGTVAEGIVGSEGVKKQLISMGDTTNTAARIQALSKDLDSLVTISESTYFKVKDDVIADPLKEMPLKGKTQKVMLYRVREIKEEALKRL